MDDLKIALTSPRATAPQFMTNGAIAMDFFACLPPGVDEVVLSSGLRRPIGLGIQMEVPQGYGLFLYSRSSWAGFKDVAVVAALTNGVGLIDSDYRGEITAIVHVLQCSNNILTIRNGDRIAQGVIQKVERPNIVVVRPEELSATTRGAGGFGSTGRA